MTPVISERTPTFSRSSAWEGVSKTTLAGWKEMGLEARLVDCKQMRMCGSSPYHPFVLLLPNVQ